MSALRLATKALLPASAAGLRRSAGLFFTISAAFCCGCVLLYSLVLPRLPAVRRRREEMLQAALQGYEPLPAGDGGGDAGGCAAAPGAPVAELSPATAGLLSGRQSPLPGRHSPLPGKQSPLKLRRRSLDVELSTKDAGFRSLQSSPLPAYRSLQASPLPPQLGLSAVVDEEAVLPGAQQESHAGGSGGSRAAPASLSDVLQRILPLASANALTFM